MNRLFLLLLILIFPVYASAQKMPEVNYTVHISGQGKTVRAEIIPFTTEIKPRPGVYYYWFSANMIHSTQGGYSGTLLNGRYTEFYPGKSLKEQGTFKKGLKNGTWKTWNEDGTLSGSVNWRNGVIEPPVTGPIWKRLNLFKRKKRIAAADSVAVK